MKCAICKNGKTHPGTTTITFEEKGNILVIQEVPAEICENCGEAYIDESVAGPIMELADKMPKVATKVDVRRYSP